MEFRNKVLIIGYGAVSKCMFPILLRHVNIPLENITIVDFKDKSADLKAWTTGAFSFSRRESARRTGETLSESPSAPGGLLDRPRVEHQLLRGLQWCRENNVLYVNTSGEAWEPECGEVRGDPVPRRRFYFRQMKLDG